MRILPAYWVCLGALVLATAGTFGPRLALLKDTAVHVVLIHDFFPTYNRDFERPLWTLAVVWGNRAIRFVFDAYLLRIIQMRREDPLVYLWG